MARAHGSSDQERQSRPQSRAQPERSCIACRRPQSKREMVRIVRTPAGTLEVDRTGKRSGRGAYLCRDQVCWEAGLKGNALEHSLHLPERLSPEIRERLLQEGLALLTPPAVTGTGEIR